tara:strand:- start:2445 stop:2552 length:108 start_codon:yes stop_codon:yes gene_type:complete
MQKRVYLRLLLIETPVIVGVILAQEYDTGMMLLPF